MTPGRGGRLEALREMLPFDWELLRHAGAEPVPYHLKKWWWCLGGTCFYLFFIQIATGLALTFYYVPSPEHAYGSVQAISQDVRLGWFIRSLHKWSADFMIVAVFLHMLRTLVTGAYRHPRQLNWMFGVMLLGITLTFGFTGYSLVYEQLSFWGATVACNLAQAVPLIGPRLGDLMRGGPEIGPNTLTRFFMLHTAILPAAALGVLGLHIFLVRLHGVTPLHFDWEKDLPKERRFFPFFPDHITTEIMFGTFLLYVLVIMALVFPAGLGEPANPLVTPEHIKPEWYFYFNFRLLKLTSLKVSVVLTGVLGTAVFFWPFIEDQMRKRLKLGPNVAVALGVLGFVGFLLLTVWEAMAV